MCARADATTTELEPTGKHGVLHAPAAAHDDTTSHDKATTTTARRHDDAKSTIHR